MSARDDLVAAMEAHEAWMNSTSDKYAEWDKCVAGALTVIRKHGPYFKALLDAEPVAWIPVSERLPDEGVWVWGLYWNDYSEQWEQEEVQYTREDGWWTEDTSMNQPKYWSAKSPLPARPEASDE